MRFSSWRSFFGTVVLLVCVSVVAAAATTSAVDALTVAGLLSVGTSGNRSTLVMQSNSATAKGRIQQSNNDGTVYMLSNVSFDGTNWNLDDTSKVGTALYNSTAGVLTFAGFTAGANPRTLASVATITFAGLLGGLSDILTTSALRTNGAVLAATYTTATNPVDSAGAAACGAAAACMFVVDAASSATTVTTSAVTVNSEVRLFNAMASQARYTGVTCNTDQLLHADVSTISAGSFVATLYNNASGAVTVANVNPYCIGVVVTN